MKRFQDPFLNRTILELSTMHEMNELDTYEMHDYQQYMKKGNRNRLPMYNKMDYSTGYRNRVYRKETIKTVKPFKIHHELVMATHNKNHKHKHQGPSYNMMK